jgi:uncharacterized circularly permuted ATP-grasp superfamily protein
MMEMPSTLKETLKKEQKKTPKKIKATAFDWHYYEPGPFYDELISSPGKARVAGQGIASYFEKYSEKALQKKQAACDLAIQEMGISFTIYSEGENIDRSWPTFADPI